MSRANRPQQPTNLSPVAQLTAGRLPERLVRLVVGLWLYGLSIALMIRGAVGASPWDVFHLGAARHLPLPFGVVMVLASVAVLGAWIPLRQAPGVGTVANAVVLGPFADLSLHMLPTPGGLLARHGYLAAGMVLCAVATAVYVGAQLGPGPRDGLMTGLARRTGLSIRLVRTGIEVTVLAVGVLLGGRAGVGTVLFALAVGPVTQLFLPYFLVPLRVSPSVGVTTTPLTEGATTCQRLSSPPLAASRTRTQAACCTRSTDSSRTSSPSALSPTAFG